MKKTIAIMILAVLCIPIFAGDTFDISLGFGHYTDYKKNNTLSLYYGATLGLTRRLEVTLGGVSEITPDPFCVNELQLGLSYAAMGERSTGSRVAGSSINTLVNTGIIVSQAKGSFLPSGVFLTITPLTIGTPIHGRRERAFELGASYNWFDNSFSFIFSFLKLDYYIRGSWHDYT